MWGWRFEEIEKLAKFNAKTFCIFQRTLMEWKIAKQKAARFHHNQLNEKFHEPNSDVRAVVADIIMLINSLVPYTPCRVMNNWSTLKIIKVSLVRHIPQIASTFFRFGLARRQGAKESANRKPHSAGHEKKSTRCNLTNKPRSSTEIPSSV